MRGLLNIFVLIFFISFFSKSYSQVDPTIPLSQRNLQNTLSNPLMNENPFIKPPEAPKKVTPKRIPKQQATPAPQQKEKAPVEEKKNEPKVKEQEKIEKKEEPKKEEPIKEEKAEKKEEQKKEESAANSSSSDDTTRDNNGLLGPFRFGPMIGFGVIIGPNISFETKIYRYLGLSISYSKYNNFNLFGIPKISTLLNNQPSSYQLDSLTLNYSQLEGKFSIFPFGGSFFIGAAYGNRTFNLSSTGSINLTIPNLPTRISTPFIENISISSTYWTPQIGWLATWGGSYGWFAIGTEFGLQLNITNTVTSSTIFTDPTANSYAQLALQSQEYTSFSDQLSYWITNVLKNDPLPYWNILKIGWMF